MIHKICTVPVPAALMAVGLLTSCRTGHLTRFAAKAQLEQVATEAQRGNPDGPQYLLAHLGRLAPCETYDAKAHYDPLHSDESTALLSAAGFLTVRPVKPNVWDVALTDLGKKSIVGEPYAHKQIGDCNKWQITIPLARYDHLEVTGIVEDGVHAQADVVATFVITPVGLAARKLASEVVFNVNKKLYGDKLAHDFQHRDVETLLSSDLAYSNTDRYTKRTSVQFEKYDDGWKITKTEKGE